MSTTNYWGEIPQPDAEMIPDVSADIERSMSKSCLDQFDSEEKIAGEKVDHILLQPMDPLMLYGIQLHKYYNEIADMVQAAETVIELQQDATVALCDSVPPMPPVPELTRLQARNSLNFIPKTFAPLSVGYEVDVPELSHAVVKQILSRCVAVMLAHAGFETTHQSELDLLTDVLEEFLQKVALQLRIATDDEEEGSFDFPNTLEKVLVDIGMNGVAGLHDYYQTRIVKYIFTLRQRCNELVEHYRKLLLPHNQLQTGSSVMEEIIRVNVKSEDRNSEDSTIIHLASTDDVNRFSSLAPGFQLLNSLEASSAGVQASDLQE